MATTDSTTPSTTGSTSRSTSRSTSHTTIQTLVPTPDVLPDVLPTEWLNERGMATPAWRDDLRQIPNARNVVAVVSTLLQSFGVVIAAAVINTWWSYLLAFVLMARGHVCLAIMGHEAAHRLLFSNRRWNDFVGRWLMSYPGFTAMLAYRRAHFTHHRDEMGPDEPDLALYSGYPAPRDSWRRKLTRDLVGISGYKNLKSLWFALRAGRTEAKQIVAVQAAMLGTAILFQRPLAYVVWILSWMTVWRFTNRLRAIAEHGGMVRSKDRRLTTHVIRQSLIARYWMVPYHTGWHLAHHVDMGVPWRNLPRLHDELVRSGWVVPDIEYPSYTAFWRACSSGPQRPKYRPDDRAESPVTS